MSIVFNYLCPKCGKLTLLMGAGACQNKFNSGAVCGYQLPRELSDFNSHVRGKIEKHTIPPTGTLPNQSSKVSYNPSTGFYLENLDAARSGGDLYLDPANGYFCTYITPSGCTTIATLCSGNAANQFTISGYKLPLNSKLQNLHGHYDNLDAEMVYVAAPENVVIEEPSAAHPHEFRVLRNGNPIAAWNTQAQSGFVGSHIVIK